MTMAIHHLAPIDYLLHVFGSYTKIAAAVKVDRSAPTMWRKRGKIPSTKLGDLLEAAERLGLDLKAEDLIRGRDVEIASPAVTEAGSPE